MFIRHALTCFCSLQPGIPRKIAQHPMPPWVSSLTYWGFKEDFFTFKIPNDLEILFLFQRNIFATLMIMNFLHKIKLWCHRLATIYQGQTGPSFIDIPLREVLIRVSVIFMADPFFTQQRF